MLLVFSCKPDEPKVMADDVFYKQVAFNVLSCYSDIYNQNVTGTPSGAVDVTGTGPMGGSVHITGTSSFDSNSGISDVDLIYEMVDVVYVTEHATMTINGSTTHQGTWGDNYISVSHLSSALGLRGDVTVEDLTRSIDSVGSASFNRSTNLISATIYGNTVTWN